VFSASSEARDWNAPTNANQIRLQQTSGIRREHRPIRYQLPARLSFRQGQPDLAALPEFERRIAAFRSEIATKRQTGKGTSKSMPLPKVGAFHIDAPKLTSEEEEMLKRLVNLD
jgi:hypothetical protein